MSNLRDNYEALLLDLDGTLYVGHDVIPSARAALESVTQRCLYVTNNASRGPAEVAGALARLGYAATEADVVTSAQAAARLLAGRLEAGAEVLVVGTDALVAEIELVGLRPVRRAESPAAVVQGHNPQTGWADLAEAAFAIRKGAVWVATNRDSTLPMERGLAPGNGSMVAAVATATDQQPIVAGKPEAPLMRDALERSGFNGQGAAQALVVGDRLDTDVAGANTVGLDSLLVLTGVAGAQDVLRAQPAQRPTYVAGSMAALNTPPEHSNGWHAEFDGAAIVLEGEGDPIHALAAVAPFAWAHPEFTGVTPRGAAAQTAIGRWETRDWADSATAVSLSARPADIG